MESNKSVVKIIDVDGNTKYYLTPEDYYGFAEEIQSNDRIESADVATLIRLKTSAGSIYLPPELVDKNVIEKVRKIDEFYREYVKPFQNLEDMKYYDIETLRPVEFRVSYPDAKHKIVEYVEDGQVVRTERYRLVKRCYEAYIRKEEECEEEYILLEQSGKAVEKGSVLRSVKSAEGRAIALEEMLNIIEEVINNHDIVIELTPSKYKPVLRVEYHRGSDLLWGECQEDKIDKIYSYMGPLGQWACDIMNLWPRFI